MGHVFTFAFVVGMPAPYFLPSKCSIFLSEGRFASYPKVQLLLFATIVDSCRLLQINNAEGSLKFTTHSRLGASRAKARTTAAGVELLSAPTAGNFFVPRSKQLRESLAPPNKSPLSTYTTDKNMSSIIDTSASQQR